MFIDVFVPYSFVLRIRQQHSTEMATVSLTLIERTFGKKNGRWTQTTTSLVSTGKAFSIDELDLPQSWQLELASNEGRFEIDQPIRRDWFDEYKYASPERLWELCKKLYPALSL
ncbi:hypothetical protein P4637_04790 [Halalkalibacterium halodurans]|jgi:hypothetical protein|uniref:BH3835 protein n=1 Tax=Halalkalibacterium halodurans (strain ATCC BAA-125 / DSM 18197 / FERM 7344 / JCM 9153 / C-125) TaxID=272558 RepID=Q9K694_HALH5|nr:hypothetical protein [Halalkalibacterium halodurans]MDY7224339.1 hypothetical protein [Halalkalibacterium halodurans]MDY7243624.1 hypothetical protein [Halalkalibacterium halodurans]MED4079544.1 hypothetical protein [Halalkalibacterium halodurans]MED4084179.1 hypothetical protein [Halalkalibacterium halodurans]MED4104657.1 hypothetical protein [Halalkalibacterium halodurans]